MKIFLAILLFLFSLNGISQAKITFEEKTHKFPKTNEGILLEHDYAFTNTGVEPLVIEGIKVACACTKFTYPKTPILPGEKGVIHVTFDTNKKYEWQNRTLVISSNAEKPTSIIRFKVMVVNDKH
ncbi:MAG: DUF1573 domain-containing protein [Flavobacteriales bacterium]|nr:DUF1573 domain-containing protein [Flavobacteriales bacterium]